MSRYSFTNSSVRRNDIWWRYVLSYSLYVVVIAWSTMIFITSFHYAVTYYYRPTLQVKLYEYRHMSEEYASFIAHNKTLSASNDKRMRVEGKNKPAYDLIVLVMTIPYNFTSFHITPTHASLLISLKRMDELSSFLEAIGVSPLVDSVNVTHIKDHGSSYDVSCRLELSKKVDF